MNATFHRMNAPSSAPSPLPPSPPPRYVIGIRERPSELRHMHMGRITKLQGILSPSDGVDVVVVVVVVTVVVSLVVVVVDQYNP